MSRSTTCMMPEQVGHRKLCGSGGLAGSAKPSKERQRSSATLRPAVGEESEVADANESARQNMKQEAAQELMSGNGHDLLLAAVGIVSPAEGDAIVFKGHESMVGDGHAMGVAGQVVENMFGAAERWLGVDNPVLPDTAAGGNLGRLQKWSDVVVSHETETYPARRAG